MTFDSRLWLSKVSFRPIRYWFANIGQYGWFGYITYSNLNDQLVWLNEGKWYCWGKWRWALLYYLEMLDLALNVTYEVKPVFEKCGTCFKIFKKRPKVFLAFSIKWWEMPKGDQIKLFRLKYLSKKCSRFGAIPKIDLLLLTKMQDSDHLG